MNSLNKKNSQRGATLLVAMIMLVVLTLLVVFAIRSGNSNLRIAGNMQVQAEAGAATQQAIEQVIEQIKVTEDISLIGAQTLPVAMGNANYSVAVQPLNKCLLDVPVLNSTLNPANDNDVACFDNPDVDPVYDASGKPLSKPSACKNQTWEIVASVEDTNSGAKVTQVQGINVRVPATVNCL